MPRHTILSVSPQPSYTRDVEVLVNESMVHLGTCYVEWFRLSDKKLSWLAAQAVAHPSRHRACLEAMQVLHKHRRRQEQDFREKLTGCFNTYFAADAASQARATICHLNDIPAITALQAKINCYFPASLAQINAAFNRLAPRVQPLDQLPFGPQNLLALFYDNLLGYGFAKEILPALIEQFEKPTLEALQQIIQTTQSTLARFISVNENLLHQQQGKPMGFRRLQTLLSQQPRDAFPGTANGVNGSGQTLTVAAFLRFASQFQNVQWQALTGDAVLETTLGARDFRLWLCQTLAAEESALGATQLSRAQEDAITLVAMLFEELFSDHDGQPLVPQPLAVLINRLQLPVLKAALLDPQFFSHPQHPVRTCLDAFVNATVGWQPAGNRMMEDILYKTLQASVVRLLHLYQQDFNVFEFEQDAFAATMSMQDARREKVIQRTLAMEQGRLRIEKAAAVIDALLSARQGSITFASGGASIIAGPWRQYLMHVYLTEGPCSETWPMALITTDHLVGCLQAKGGKEDKALWTQHMPGMMRRLNEAMESIKYPKHELARLNKALWQHQIEHLQLFPHELRRVKLVDQPAPLNPHWFNQAVRASQTRSENPYTSALSLLKPGQWVRITLENRTHTVRYAGHLEEVEVFSFVTYFGVKFDNMKADTLAELIAKNSLIVQDTPLWTSTAIDAMAKKLTTVEVKVPTPQWVIA